jgi:hypothetical protein
VGWHDQWQHRAVLALWLGDRAAITGRTVVSPISSLTWLLLTDRRIAPRLGA